MRLPNEENEHGSLRLSRPLAAAAVLAALAVLGGMTPRTAAAQDLPAAPAATAETAAASPAAAESPTAPPPQGGDASPADGGEDTAHDAVDGVSAHMTAAKLLLVDVREVLRSPEHWQGRQWALFGFEVAAVVGVGAADESLQRDARRRRSKTADNIAKDFRTFGNYGSFEVLGGFYIGGLIAHDKKAQETTLDGLFASGIAGGLISPFLKVVTGRTRPNRNVGAYKFHPFSIHYTSFPSGESAQAFAVASVISTQYPHFLVEFIAYGAATLTSLGRIRENGHWSSDTLAGIFIGYHVGRAVVHINQRLRARVRVAPLIEPHARGLTLSTAF